MDASLLISLILITFFDSFYQIEKGIKIRVKTGLIIGKLIEKKEEEKPRLRAELGERSPRGKERQRKWKCHWNPTTEKAETKAEEVEVVVVLETEDG